ncbi:hypothetical protein HDU82_001509 [Entophlyctis luteolus]|nr:hypothetical protein HDU82_001509 [Entophlyctis luteolus]
MSDTTDTDDTATAAADSATTTSVTLLSSAQCTQFADACKKIGPTSCSGSWSYGCSSGTTVAAAQLAYPSGVCARCLCNSQTQLLPDLTCIVGANSTSSTDVEGGGDGSMNSTTSVGPPMESGGSNNAYALPLYLSLTLIAVASAGIAVYFYMKRKNLRLKRENMMTSETYLHQPPPPFSEASVGTTGRPKSLTKRTAENAIVPSKSQPRKPWQSIWTTTTTTTTTKDPQADSDKTVQTTTVMVHAYPPSVTAGVDSSTDIPLGVPVSDAPSVQHTPFLPSDSFLTPSYVPAAFGNQQYSLEEQWQWEQYQAAMQWHQWQLAQKEWQASQRQYYLAKEEERRRKLADGAVEEESVNPKRPAGLLMGNHRPSPLRFGIVQGDTESVLSRVDSLNSQRKSFYDTIVSGRYSVELPNSAQPSGFMSMRSKEGSMTGRSSVRSATATSVIVATSPEWSAPPDLVRVGSEASGTRRRFPTPNRTSGEEKEPGTAMSVSSSTFALGNDVSVITMTSIGEDGEPVTSQILSSAPTLTSGNRTPHRTLSGRQSPSEFTSMRSISRVNSTGDSASVLEPSNTRKPSGGLVPKITEGDTEYAIEWDAPEIDNDGQLKYIVRKAHTPASEDELRLDLGDEVVLWHILEDGLCEGYCVGKKQKGYFPVKCAQKSAMARQRKAKNAGAEAKSQLKVVGVPMLRKKDGIINESILD